MVADLLILFHVLDLLLIASNEKVRFGEIILIAFLPEQIHVMGACMTSQPWGANYRSSCPYTLEKTR